MLAASGRTLYTFDKDAAGKSNCNGGCAAVRPPFLVKDGDRAPAEFRVIARDDGSKVLGTAKERADAPAADAIPWLLLRAKPAGPEGAFSKFTSVQRVSTVGGAAPKDGCSQAAAGTVARINYTAEYRFFTSPGGEPANPARPGQRGRRRLPPSAGGSTSKLRVRCLLRAAAHRLVFRGRDI